MWRWLQLIAQLVLVATGLLALALLYGGIHAPNW